MDIILCLLICVLPTLVSTQTCAVDQTLQYKTYPNRNLTYIGLSKTYVVSGPRKSTACLGLCESGITESGSQTFECKAFNFNEDAGQCQLLDRTTDSAPLETLQGWDFYQKECQTFTTSTTATPGSGSTTTTTPGPGSTTPSKGSTEGSQGATGSTGATGRRGQVGQPGGTGSRGLQGGTGHTGRQGPDGSIGFTGATGPNGPRGATGPFGPEGPSGQSGPGGAQGPVGATGATGNQGVTGRPGASGPVGPTGSPGTKGTKGGNGLTGPTGLTGATGARGMKGLIGNLGPTGAPGSTGATGPTGLSGATGIIGPPGNLGPKGDIGFTGLEGPQGPRGFVGPKGDLGDIGMKGDIGPVGPTSGPGTKGQKGEPGSLAVAALMLDIPPAGDTPGVVGPLGLVGTGSIDALTDGCDINNGGCSQTCVDTWHSHHCVCTPGYRLVNEVSICEVCEAKADIALMLDVSAGDPSGTEPEQWAMIQRLAGDIIESVDINVDINRISLISTADEAEIKVPLGSHQNENHLLRQIFSLTRTYNGLNVGQGLQIVRDHVFTPTVGTSGDRSDVSDIGIIIFDEHPGNDVIHAAKLAKKEGIKLIAVHIGNTVTKAVLDQIAYDSSMAYLIQTEDDLITALAQILKNVSGASSWQCEESDKNIHCIHTIDGHKYCFCQNEKGTRSTNGTLCLNIDECLGDNGGCQDTCVDTEAGYHCQCPSQYNVSADGHNCTRIIDNEQTGDALSHSDIMSVLAMCVAVLNTLIIISVSIWIVRRHKRGYPGNSLDSRPYIRAGLFQGGGSTRSFDSIVSKYSQNSEER